MSVDAMIDAKARASQHIRAELKCCGRCSGDRRYNGTDYDTHCSCYRECIGAVRVALRRLAALNGRAKR
jgi:hypothetical protein